MVEGGKGPEPVSIRLVWDDPAPVAPLLVDYCRKHATRVQSW
jgi:hypothetical protein